MKEYVINKSIYGRDIKRVRALLKMSQKEFADLVGCSKRTVENWESKDGEITGPIVTLVEILIRRPDLVSRLELPPKKYNIRLLYMYENTVCTVIVVDELHRLVEIRNYIDDPLFRAFGVNTEPAYEDYEEFLRSRCFPESRDKMKIELKNLGLPFYDPLMIIGKTGGRMEEDKFSIEIVR